MRIVAGMYRSRVIQSVEGDNTRPTSDKIKGAIFSSLGSYFDGGVMLDLFGGSGNMGFEAISRGVELVYFCDHNKKAIQTIEKNCTLLKVNQQCKIVQKDYQSFLNECASNHQQFDIIFLDPPYKMQAINTIVSFIEKHQLLKDDGVIVCESAKEEEIAASFNQLIQVKQKVYGISKITFFRRK